MVTNPRRVDLKAGTPYFLNDVLKRKVAGTTSLEAVPVIFARGDN